jgi:hypothetical protein
MKGMLRFAMGALCALTIAGVYARDRLDWQDWSGWTTQIEFDLNAGNLVTTGAINTTIAIGNQAPAVLDQGSQHLEHRSQPQCAYRNPWTADA